MTPAFAKGDHAELAAKFLSARCFKRYMPRSLDKGDECNEHEVYEDEADESRWLQNPIHMVIKAVISSSIYNVHMGKQWTHADKEEMIKNIIETGRHMVKMTRISHARATPGTDEALH